MGMKEILDKEYSKERDKAKIVFYCSGEWYKAYEMSAYLAHFFYGFSDEKHRLVPVHKKFKGLDEGIVYVGIKVSMVEKFFPDTVPTFTKDTMEINVDLSKYKDLIVDKLEENIKTWKVSTPFKDDTKVCSGAPKYLTDPMTMSSILKTILKYPLEQHTPEESYKFIRELKDAAISLI